MARKIHPPDIYNNEIQRCQRMLNLIIKDKRINEASKLDARRAVGTLTDIMNRAVTPDYPVAHVGGRTGTT